MGKLFLRKYIRKKVEEYGNMAFYKVNAHPEYPTVFPSIDKDKPHTPQEIDFWNDIEFSEKNESENNS